MAKIIKMKSEIGLRLHKKEAYKFALKILSELDDCQDAEIEVPLSFSEDQTPLLDSFLLSERQLIRDDIAKSGTDLSEEEIEMITEVALGSNTVQMVVLEAIRFISESDAESDPHERIQKFIDSNPDAQRLIKKNK